MTDERKIATIRLYKHAHGPLTHQHHQSSWNIGGAKEKPREAHTYLCTENRS